MQPQEILRYCADVLRKMGFSGISVKGDILYYKGELLVRWLFRVYPISEDVVEGYAAFFVISQYWEGGAHEIPEEAEGIEDIIITDCVASILGKEVFKDILPVCFDDGEKFYICPLHPSSLTIEIPIYKSDEMSPTDYRIAITCYGEKGVEKITETKPSDFETLRKVITLALL
jgi:hypothetical protein